MELKNKLEGNGKTALVVEGGAMRGIFSTGVLDAFLEKKFNPFDLCIGVSAGSTNLAAYLAEMYQRNYRIYIDYSIRREFINWFKFVKGGHLVDLDWLWDITIKEIRLDLDRIVNSKSKYIVGVTEVTEGKAIYLEPNKANLEELIKASSAIPLFYRNIISIMNIKVVDGGIADPIPVIEAYNRGANKIVVIRSRPFNYNMSNSNSLLNEIFFRKKPGLLRALKNRADVYQRSIEFIRNPPNGVKVLEINPTIEFKTNRLTKNINILNKDYSLGYKAGLDLIDRWSNSY